MARQKPIPRTGRVREADSANSNDHFDVAYSHYIGRCRTLGVDPMPPEELRELLASAHGKAETQPPQI